MKGLLLVAIGALLVVSTPGRASAQPAHPHRAKADLTSLKILKDKIAGSSFVSIAREDDRPRRRGRGRRGGPRHS